MKKRKPFYLILISIVLICSFAGCQNSKATFSGSKTANDNHFLLDFDVLNSTVNNNMPLSKGETIETAIDIKKGDVDILVENKNGNIVYRGNNVEKNCTFTFGINETGNYTFYVTGSKAKGSISFIKSSSDEAM